MAQIIVDTVEFFHIKSKSLKIDCIHSIIVIKTFFSFKLIASKLLHLCQRNRLFLLTETVPNIFNHRFLIHNHVTVVPRRLHRIIIK